MRPPVRTLRNETGRGGIPTEYFDVCDENGVPTGAVVERGEAHRKGVRHRTAHVWIVREKEGRTEVLLQKRSRNKDSFPGLYDTSSAGHVPAGEEPLPSALRELREELGIRAAPEQLRRIGHIENVYRMEFHGQEFRDNEYCTVYVYEGEADASALRLQPEEVERADWFDLEAVLEEIDRSRDRFCVPREGLELVKSWCEKKKRGT